MFVRAIQNSWLPSFEIFSPEIETRIKNIALKCLKEFSFSLALKFVISSFVVTSAGLSLLFNTMLIQLTVSLFLNTVSEFSSYKRDQNNASSPLYEKLATTCNWLSSLNFAILTGYDTQNLVHETGHAITSTLLYKNARPVIELFPLKGGLTQFYKNGLSGLGKSLGPSSTTFLISLAGPALTLLLSTAFLGLGIGMRKEYPNLSKYLISWSLLDFINHANYAYSALDAEQWNLLHDFVHLSVFGVHPLAACVGILSIPIIVGVGMYLKEAHFIPITINKDIK